MSTTRDALIRPVGMPQALCSSFGFGQQEVDDRGYMLEVLAN